MGLEVISGPPGSGRGGAIVERFREALDRDPVLVAPTSDDVDRLERELCATPGGVLGGTITSFPGLFGEVARAVGVESPPPLTPIQVTWLAREAAAATDLRLLGRSSGHEGFAPALAGLIGELQSAGFDAAALAVAVEEAGGGAYEQELAGLFASYERLRDAAGAVDEHQLAGRATASLRTRPRAWGGRPVLLYGFDDLTREQIELVGALAAAAEVTVTVTFEDRSALAARAELLGVLRDELGASVTEVAPGDDGEGATVLRHLERNLFEPAAERIAVDDSLRVLEGAGERGEAEMIGRRIARLLADGTDPDEIAIAVRATDRQGPPLARSLQRMGIPIAAEAGVPLSATATGAALRELIAIAAGEASAATVVSYLRRPGRASPASVDWLERRVRRDRLATADEALAAWAGGFEEPRRIWSLDDLRAAGEDPAAIARVLARTAADVAEREHRRSGLVPSGADAIELRAASAAGRALAEAVALGERGPRDLGAFGDLLAQVRVPLWRGPTEGRVRILSPYRLRATRVSHLFVAGLADGSFPAAGGADPLLGDERRRLLGLPARTDPIAEERYLFYTCVAKPERCLHLSYAASDEAGAEAPRSPFIDDVLDLIAAPAGTSGPIERSTLADFVPAPEEASTPHDLARALAAFGRSAPERAAGLDLPAEAAEGALAAVESALARVEAAREPGPLRAEAVLAELGGRDLFGASTLEEFLGCSYRWFVNHELRPRRIDPDPDALESGGIVHETLERLFREPPDGGPRPREDTCERWVGRARELIREIAAERGWDLESASACISLARLDAVVERLLRRDAASDGPLLPDPALLEARFGDGPDDRFPAADFGTFRLHGAIDRIDVAEGRALIRDYKLSAKAVAGAKLSDEGRLQLPLYMIAARGFGLEPIGGLYSPLAATRDDRPRGLLSKEHRGTLIPGATEDHYRSDFFETEQLDEMLERAVATATRVVADIRAGRIDRNPRDGKCPAWCTLAPVCRVERGIAALEDEEEEEGAL